MLNTDELRTEADDQEGFGNTRIAGVLRDAADEIDAGRNARLDRCRDRASRVIAGEIAAGMVYVTDAKGTGNEKVASQVEDLAHAMLAAERAPEVKP